MKATDYTTRYLLTIHTKATRVSRTMALVRALSADCPVMGLQLVSSVNLYGHHALSYNVALRSRSAISSYDLIRAIARIREVAGCSLDQIVLALIP